MWNGKGRSGIGDSTIIGEYDDWAGLSMNGRQYKNEAIMETRNLSGADYWHLRKQNRPTEEIPEHLHMKNNMANLAAYADKEQPKKPTKKKLPIASRILSQNTTLNRLDSQEAELNEAFQNGELDNGEYSDLSYALQVKRDRAVKALYRATGRLAEYEAVGYDGSQENSSPSPVLASNPGYSGGVSRQGKEEWSEDLKNFLIWSFIGAIVLLWFCN